MNNPNYYLNFVKNVLRKVSGGSRYINISHVEASKQHGTKDCGLFALVYALALAKDIDPGCLIFDQRKPGIVNFGTKKQYKNNQTSLQCKKICN
ncbi:unnamed protein product [Brachionus calyciflorus]|uniref:Uncharacterized protein n=1 Tax=Brachionus calyciflorus TaxID=104777 RepID=A0A813ZY26_9BILA|nr:unnamed protein product [Brachionus calyciflorus]